MGSDPFFNTSNLLPDLESQIASYLSSTSTLGTPGITFLVISIGFWDIYSLANLSRDVSLIAINQCFEEILTQINKLHGVFRMFKTMITENLPHEFQVILPKVPDPTLAPGWLSQRPIPLRPSTVAEQQRNAVYLAERWNHKLETLSRLWATTQSSILSENYPSNKTAKDMSSNLLIPDFPELLQNLALNYYHQVASSQINKSVGVGKLAFKSVNEACAQLERPNERYGTNSPDSKYLKICSQPDEYLWWDAWHIGAVGNSILGAAENAVPRISRAT
ncbi:hypothetical protein EPUL_002788 [Erysiphe pulchra]|uniref:SGNH hydrolase-type esterase domain-containing protein n=1 Tax=Erysiphe pulchra TaxID=225359 RepID=A0A2S4PTD8_9PEZI|nr:hypothetical protein EPUL_002788 [Erysiphe pulchra]